MSVDERAKKKLEEIFEREIGDEFLQKNEDDWDSLRQIEIISELEAEFGISLTPKEIGSMISFASIVRIIKEHGAE